MDRSAQSALPEPRPGLGGLGWSGWLAGSGWLVWSSWLAGNGRLAGSGWLVRTVSEAGSDGLAAAFRALFDALLQARRIAVAILLAGPGVLPRPVLIRILGREEQLRQPRQAAVVLVSPPGTIVLARVVELPGVAPLTGVARSRRAGIGGQSRPPWLGVSCVESYSITSCLPVLRTWRPAKSTPGYRLVFCTPPTARPRRSVFCLLEAPSRVASCARAWLCWHQGRGRCCST